jgi:ketosteroid isomerase-like protein
MSVMDQMPIEAARQELLEAYKAGDAVRLVACCSEDVVQLPPNEPGPCEGGKRSGLSGPF